MSRKTIDIAIVTSVWGDYGQYLPAWAESLAAQQHPPTNTVINDAGVTDKAALAQAVKTLQDNNIPNTVVRKRFWSVGKARNQAVEAADNEWIIHLDADDVLLPHAISDVAEIADRADVVSLGAIRNGAAQVFPGITAEQILNRKHGMFSCGAFRKSFWQRRPWHTKNVAVDSVFWVGLAHLGARFASTGRVGFVYVQHEDSISRSLTPEQKKHAVRQWLKACDRWTLN